MGWRGGGLGPAVLLVTLLLSLTSLPAAAAFSGNISPVLAVVAPILAPPTDSGFRMTEEEASDPIL